MILQVIVVYNDEHVTDYQGLPNLRSAYDTGDSDDDFGASRVASRGYQSRIVQYIETPIGIMRMDFNAVLSNHPNFTHESAADRLRVASSSGKWKCQ